MNNSQTNKNILYVAESPYEGLIGASKSIKKCYEELKAYQNAIPSLTTFRKKLQDEDAHYAYDGEAGDGWGIRKTHIL